jgi:hypothetical protein
MKIKLITRFSQATALLILIAVCTGNAFAIENKSRVVSPYWQSDSSSYSFIAVTHPSLSGMNSQIGVTINAIQKDKSAFGTATSFTVEAGNTTRVFIVRTNQSSINSTSISSAQFIVGSTDFEHGHVRIDPVATNPGDRTIENVGAGFRDVSMLSYWGAVVIESNTTGFAMEFIGDAHDSAATNFTAGTTGVSGVGAP